jgi:hypothetical protein
MLVLRIDERILGFFEGTQKGKLNSTHELKIKSADE